MFLSSAEGVVQPVAFREIEEARYSSVSLMPEGLDQLLKPEEIADLVAYLKESKPLTESALNRRGWFKKRYHLIARSRCPACMRTHRRASQRAKKSNFASAATFPMNLSVVQLGSDPESRDADPVLHDVSRRRAEAAADPPGSYVHVADGLPAERPLTSLTLECWIRPFALGGWQGLINQHDYPRPLRHRAVHQRWTDCVHHRRRRQPRSFVSAPDRAGLDQGPALASRRGDMGRESKTHLHRRITGWRVPVCVESSVLGKRHSELALTAARV